MHYIYNPYSYFSHPHPAFALGIEPPRSASTPLQQFPLPTTPQQLSVLCPEQPAQSPRMPCISRAASSSLIAARAALARRANSAPLEKDLYQNTALARRCISVRPSTPVSFSPQESPSPEEHAQMERIMRIRGKITAQQLLSGTEDLGMPDASPSPASERQQEIPETPRNIFDIALAGIELMLQDMHQSKQSS